MGDKCQAKEADFQRLVAVPYVPRDVMEAEALAIGKAQWEEHRRRKAQREQLVRITSRLRSKYVPQPQPTKHPTGATKATVESRKAKSRAKRKASRRTR